MLAALLGVPPVSVQKQRSGSVAGERASTAGVSSITRASIVCTCDPCFTRTGLSSAIATVGESSQDSLGISYG